jgi:hypothetical protein
MESKHRGQSASEPSRLRWDNEVRHLRKMQRSVPSAAAPAMAQCARTSFGRTHERFTAFSIPQRRSVVDVIRNPETAKKI